MHKVENSLKN